MKTNYPKIFIYKREKGSKDWLFCCVTTWSATCREASKRYREAKQLPENIEVKAWFEKG